MASVTNWNPPWTLELNPLNFTPVFIPDNPSKTSEKILCLEGKSPGLYPAPAGQLRQAWLAGPCRATCILLGDSPVRLGQWHHELFPYLPKWQVCVRDLPFIEKWSKICGVLTRPHVCVIWRRSLWGCGLMVLHLICHTADSLAKPRASSCRTRWRSWWQHVARSSLAPNQAVLRLTESVSLHAINLPLGLPKMLSQLLVADIFQLPMWNSLWGPTAELRVCLRAVSWEWADKIAFLTLCPSWLFLKGLGYLPKFIRMWM